jgi:hypothetical protein
MAWLLFLSQPIQEETAHEKNPLVRVKEADGKKSTIKTAIRDPWEWNLVVILQETG